MKYALLAYSRGETSGERRTREMPPGVAAVLTVAAGAQLNQIGVPPALVEHLFSSLTDRSGALGGAAALFRLWTEMRKSRSRHLRPRDRARQPACAASTFYN